MGIIAVVTLAGSAGKSTTANSLATQIALSGRRTTIIDFDAQSTTSMWFDCFPPDPGKSIADVITRETTFSKAARQVDRVPNLRVIPSSRDELDRLSVELARATGTEMAFYRALRNADTEDEHIIIDCPGSYSALVLAAILATQADKEDDESPGLSGVLTCTQPTLKENLGLGVLLEELETIQETYNRTVELLGIVPCAVPPLGSGDVYEEQLADVRGHFGELVTPSVRRSVVVPEAFSKSVPLPLFSKARLVNNDYADVLKHLQGRKCLI